jgi:hypothetical protein
VAIIVSGDGDFVSLVDAAQRAGLRVEVAATPRQTSTDLIDVADRFIDLEANARTYARAELPRPYTGTLGRPPIRGQYGTGQLGENRPYPMREQAEAGEGQRSFEPQRPYPAANPPAQSNALNNTASNDEIEDEDEQQPPTSDPRLLRRSGPPLGRQ